MHLHETFGYKNHMVLLWIYRWEDLKTTTTTTTTATAKFTKQNKTGTNKNESIS